MAPSWHDPFEGQGGPVGGDPVPARDRPAGDRKYNVLLLATTETKHAEIAYTVEALRQNGVTARVCDVSLKSAGRILKGPDKMHAMRKTAHDIIHGIGPLLGPHYKAMVGLGGGTGGQIIIDVMRALPFSYPKVLVTTLPFDPRNSVADTSIIIVPALADISGLNATLRQVLDNAAAMVAGICANPRQARHVAEDPSIGITALGSTNGGIEALTNVVQHAGREATVFHSNGYGGAAFVRWCASGAFSGAIDYTTHEMTRLRIAGSHTEMPQRFTAAAQAHIPHVVLPGAMNFIGLGEVSLVQKRFLERPHYFHSALFTHVKVTEKEMVDCAEALADALTQGTAPCHVIVPMGGFSSEDRPDGAIEDEDLRGVFLDTMRRAAGNRLAVTPIDDHINSPECAQTAFDTLQLYM